MDENKAFKLYRLAAIMFGISTILNLFAKNYTFAFTTLCLFACFILLSKYYEDNK